MIYFWFEHGWFWGKDDMEPAGPYPTYDACLFNYAAKELGLYFSVFGRK